jgi:hypothetical protein
MTIRHFTSKVQKKQVLAYGTRLVDGASGIQVDTFSVLFIRTIEIQARKYRKFPLFSAGKLITTI